MLDKINIVTKVVFDIKILMICNKINIQEKL